MLQFLLTALFFFLVLLVCAIIFLILHGRIKLSEEARNQAIKSIQSTKNLHPEHALIKSHKAFIQALKSIKKEYKNLTAAQVTAKLESKITKKQAIWRFHGLRNKAAHNPDFRIYNKTAQEARKLYIETLKQL